MIRVGSETAAPPNDRGPARVGFRALTLGSIGVVYGDIGTSPLYAFREAVVAAADSGPITREIVLGVLSRRRQLSWPVSDNYLGR
jgi:KUP system potassium uptake protein